MKQICQKFWRTFLLKINRSSKMSVRKFVNKIFRHNVETYLIKTKLSVFGCISRLRQFKYNNNHAYYSCICNSRKIWEILYNKYDGKLFTEMDRQIVECILLSSVSFITVQVNNNLEGCSQTSFPTLLILTFCRNIKSFLKIH